VTPVLPIFSSRRAAANFFVLFLGHQIEARTILLASTAGVSAVDWQNGSRLDL